MRSQLQSIALTAWHVAVWVQAPLIAVWHLQYLQLPDAGYPDRRELAKQCVCQTSIMQQSGSVLAQVSNLRKVLDNFQNDCVASPCPLYLHHRIPDQVVHLLPKAGNAHRIKRLSRC